MPSFKVLRARPTVLGALTMIFVQLVAAVHPAGAAAPLEPPPLSILTSSGHAAGHDGAIFVSPFGRSDTYANGAEILDASGKVIWFHPVPAGQEAADFRTQTYRGKPVLTWWQGTGLGGLASGVDYIYDRHYRQIAEVHAGNGYTADGHEFLITPNDTALVLAYTTATADLTGIGGAPDQTVVNGVVQEIDIRTGKVLFEWNSQDHVPFAESEQPLPAAPTTPWDWFHINAVHLDSDGNLLVDARNTWTVYKVDRRTGHIDWKLGGKDSSFTLRAGPGEQLNAAGKLFAWQHDPEALGSGRYTVFDNDSTGAPLYPTSRVVTVQLDTRRRLATLVSSINQPEGLVAPSQGNAQTTETGNLVVGWGALPYFAEFSRSGELLFDARFPDGVNSYRAYRLPWPAHR
ncbi:MAG: hypothetical protein QOI15_253 [Pseudonocardiales bacterium]|nr:hypothetical protein [Pseudonocardiales bacterium]